MSNVFDCNAVGKGSWISVQRFISMRGISFSEKKKLNSLVLSETKRKSKFGIVRGGGGGGLVIWFIKTVRPLGIRNSIGH